MTHSQEMPAGTAAIDRTLRLFEAIVRDDANRPLSLIATELGLPPSTANRMAALLMKRGLIAPSQRGRYRAGLKVLDLAERVDANRIIADAARPALRKIAHDTQTTAHLGVWDDDMVTYLIKESSASSILFTKEGGQLEAYCSAIGKVLLAHLDPDNLARYLSAGPFVALTGHTVVEPEQISAMIRQVHQQGFATDEQEIADDLFCIAVPVQLSDGRIVGAISLSRTGNRRHLDEQLARLRSSATAISARLGQLGGTPAG